MDAVSTAERLATALAPRIAAIVPAGYAVHASGAWLTVSGADEFARYRFPLDWIVEQDGDVPEVLADPEGRVITFGPPGPQSDHYSVNQQRSSAGGRGDGSPFQPAS